MKMKQCLQDLYLVFSHVADSSETAHCMQLRVQACGVALPEMSLIRVIEAETSVKTGSFSLSRLSAPRPSLPCVSPRVWSKVLRGAVTQRFSEGSVLVFLPPPEVCSSGLLQEWKSLWKNDQMMLFWCSLGSALLPPVITARFQNGKVLQSAEHCSLSEFLWFLFSHEFHTLSSTNFCFRLNEVVLQDFSVFLPSVPAFQDCPDCREASLWCCVEPRSNLNAMN